MKDEVDKETDKDTKFVKEEYEPTRNYIFQKSNITKIAVVIVIAFLVLLILGIIASGTAFFESD